MTWQELNNKISTENNRGFFEAKFHHGNYTNHYGIAQRFISGSTVRAFRRPDQQLGDVPLNWHRPKLLLQSWLLNNCFNGADLNRNQFEDIHNDFRTFHTTLVNNLCTYWEQHQNQVLKKGHARKVVEVFLKTLIQYQDLPENLRNIIKNNAYIPLDSIVLSELREELNTAYLDNIKPLPINGNIAMGIMNKEPYVEDDVYYGIQETIQNQINNDFPRIYADFILWDLNERRPIQNLIVN